MVEYVLIGDDKEFIWFEYSSKWSPIQDSLRGNTGLDLKRSR